MRRVVVIAVAFFVASACDRPHADSDANLRDTMVTACSISDPRETFIKPSNRGEHFSFGYGGVAVSADGNTLAIGAEGEPSASTGVNGDQNDVSAVDAGAVYVFTRSSGLWTQQAYLKASNTAPNGFFGAVLALSADGNTLAVGAVGDASRATGINGDQTDTSLSFAGAVYVYVRTGSTWLQQAYVKSSNTAPNDRFGIPALSADGSTLAVADDANGIYVFARVGSTWTQQASVSSSGRVALSADGNTLAVGGAGLVSIRSRVGSVWGPPVYVNSPATWDIAFGAAVALSADANTIAISAPNDSSAATGINGNEMDTSLQASGAAFVFARAGMGWTQAAYFKASNPDTLAFFGTGIALSADGRTLAVAAPSEASGATGIDGNQADTSAPRSGAVYLFGYEGFWSQKAYVKASNSAANDWFGGDSVALSGDGSILVSGAPNEASAAVGVGGDQCDRSAPERGAVYVVQ